VWVLAHPEYRSQVEAYLDRNPVPTLRFEWMTLPKLMDPWNPETGRGSVRLHYVLWQRAALRSAARLHAQVGFDISHQVSWTSISAPPLLWRLPIPFVWGPVGGGQTVPEYLMPCLGSTRMRERVRNVLIALAPHTPGLRNAVRFSAEVIAVNPETICVLKKAGAQELRCWPDTAVEADAIAASVPERRAGDDLVLHWCGWLEHKKGLGLALDALSRIRDTPWRLEVFGRGPHEQEYRRIAHRLKIADRVHFRGFVSRTTLLEQFRTGHVFLFTSLRDTFGTVLFEAMSQGLPVITLAHQGAGAHVPASCAIKIPPSSPDSIRTGLSEAISRLGTFEYARLAMGKMALEFAARETWGRRVSDMTAIYQAAVLTRDSI
jgi:glycosyltransferase involved in cell wall biosynthesis